MALTASVKRTCTLAGQEILGSGRGAVRAVALHQWAAHRGRPHRDPKPKWTPKPPRAAPLTPSMRCTVTRPSWAS